MARRISYRLKRDVFDMKRAERGLGIEEVIAEFPGLRNWLYRKTRKRVSPRPHSAKRFAEFFGCEISDLFDIEVL